MPHLGATAVANPLPQFQETSGIITGGDVWTIWNQTYTSATTGTGTITAVSSTSTTGNSAVWTIWNQVYNASATAAYPQVQVVGSGTQIIANQTTVGNNTEIWGHWNRTYTTNRVQYAQGMVPAPARALTDEERAARAAEQARWAEQRQAAQAEEAKAQERAEKLLQQSLDEKQRSELKANGYFELDVISKNGDRRRYRIHRKWSASIHQIDPASGKRLKTLCIHPGMQVPVADSMLAQKLMLESGMEEELLRVANHSF